MKRPVFALLAGALFGAGLIVAGMTQPARVIGFLSPTGAWDPTLAVVMVAAVAVYAVFVRAIGFSLPARRDLDARLLIGAALFGAGWGIGGFCPGPGIVAAAAGNASALLFVLAMIAGMIVHDRFMVRRRARPAAR